MNESEYIDNNTFYNPRTYSYRDMLDAWMEGRLNLVKWGVGEGDKPGFSSWMYEKYNVKNGGLIQACLHPSKQEIYDVLDTVPYFRSENESASIIMKHFKGLCNPQMVKEIVNQYRRENFTNDI